jgi:hypothetical protein
MRPGLIFLLLVFLLGFLLGFACGFGVRAWISRRRRYRQRQDFFLKMWAICIRRITFLVCPDFIDGAHNT